MAQLNIMYNLVQPSNIRAVGGIIGWLKKIYNIIVSLGEFIVSLVSSLLQAIAWLPRLLSSIFQSIGFMPPLIGIFCTLAVTFLVVNYLADRK